MSLDDKHNDAGEGYVEGEEDELEDAEAEKTESEEE